MQFRSDMCLTQSEGLGGCGPVSLPPRGLQGWVGHKCTGYESGGPQGGPRWARSSGTAQKSCCHRRDTCGLQQGDEGSIQAPLIPDPASSPARDTATSPTPARHPHSTSGPPGHTQVLPELRFDSNLQQLVLKQDPTILTHEPRQGGGSEDGRAPHHPSLRSPPVPELTYSTVHPLLEWEDLCPQDLGWGTGRGVMHRGLEERGTGNTLLEGRSPEPTGQASPETLGMGVGPQRRDLPRTPAFTAGVFVFVFRGFHCFLTLRLPVIRNP